MVRLGQGKSIEFSQKVSLNLPSYFFFCIMNSLDSKHPNLLSSCTSFIGLPVPRFFGRLEGVGTVGRKTFIDKDFKGVQQAHYNILQHLTIMTPLVNEHLSIVRAESNGLLDDWMRELKCGLTAWLKDLDLPDGETVEE